MINSTNIVIILGIIILETSSQILARKFYDSGKDNNKIWYLTIDADVSNNFIDMLDKKIKSI